MLAQALEALVDGSLVKPDEIIVVNGGDARADRVVAGFAMRGTVPVKLVKTKNINLATSRNIGLAECTGEIVAFTDDDAQVFPDWVRCVKQLHAEHPEAGAIGGAVVGTESKRRLSRIADIATFVSPRVSCQVRNLPGVNVSYKHPVIRQVGPQDETLERGEDVDYNWRVKESGYMVLYHPAMRVNHYHRPTLREFFRQHHMYGRSYYLVRNKWRAMYCVYPHGLHRPRDILKALHVIIAILYQPFQLAWQLESTSDKVLGVPILFINQLAWKSGMLYQFFQSHK